MSYNDFHLAFKIHHEDFVIGVMFRHENMQHNTNPFIVGINKYMSKAIP